MGLGEKIKDAVAGRRKAQRKKAEQAQEIEQEKRDLLELRKKRHDLQEQIEALPKDDPKRDTLIEERRRTSEQIAGSKHDRDHAHKKHREWLDRFKGWTRRLAHLRELRREKKLAHPEPQPWHGNGHEWSYLTSRAKQLLAVAVVLYKCSCTSIFRTWGTGSFHEEKPTRGFDCAGQRMADFQRDLRAGRIEGFDLGDLLELFGPDNAACADNGRPYSMAEGSAIEQLHDSHAHAFVYS